MRKSLCLVVMAMLLAAAGTVGAAAQAIPTQPAFPTQPVRLVTVLSPGTDTYIRVLAERLAAIWAKPVLVEVNAWFVGKNGRLDLTNVVQRARAEYLFSNPATGRARRIVLDSTGLAVREDIAFVASRRVPPAPQCTIPRLWQNTFPEAAEASRARIAYAVDSLDPSQGIWTIELANGAALQHRRDEICMSFSR